MEHPFISNLSAKSLEELQTTISELMGKLNFAYKMGNQNMANQLQMAIGSYRNEYTRKMDELAKKQDVQTKISIEKER
jgi:hypothetical protein